MDSNSGPILSHDDGTVEKVLAWPNKWRFIFEKKEFYFY